MIVSGGTGRIYSYKAELKDRFNIEGLKEIVGNRCFRSSLAESLPEYKTEEPDIPDSAPKRLQVRERPSVLARLRQRRSEQESKVNQKRALDLLMKEKTR